MEDFYKKEFKQTLEANKNCRDVLARDGVLSLYSFLSENGYTPMKRMAIIEAFVYYPLIVDGPINEDELHFITVALNQNELGLEEANFIAQRNTDVRDVLFQIIKDLKGIAVYDVLNLVFIGLIVDNNDDMNDIEFEFFDELFLKVLETL